MINSGDVKESTTLCDVCVCICLHMPDDMPDPTLLDRCRSVKGLMARSVKAGSGGRRRERDGLRSEACVRCCRDVPEEIMVHEWPPLQLRFRRLFFLPLVWLDAAHSHLFNCPRALFSLFLLMSVSHPTSRLHSSLFFSLFILLRCLL